MAACLSACLSVASRKGAPRPDVVLHVCVKRINLSVEAFFNRWIRTTLARKTALLKHNNDIMSDRLAALQQKVADQDCTIHRLLAQEQGNDRRHRSRARHSKCCLVCAHDTKETVSCTRGHAVCLSCVGARAHSEIDAVDEETTSLACFSTEGCDGCYELADLLRSSDKGEAFVREIHHQKTLRLVNTLLAKEGGPEKDIILKFVRADGSFRGLACPECHFGPMLHADCDDLLEWHERNGFSNTCPQCGHLSQKASTMRTWEPFENFTEQRSRM